MANLLSYNVESDEYSMDSLPKPRVLDGKHNLLEETEFNSRYLNYDHNSSSDDENFVEIRIDEGDTLTAICLKYGCRVSQIKQLNNLFSDQDFYALNSIKLPATKYGYLKELVKEQGLIIKNSKRSGTYSDFIANEYDDCLDNAENETLLVQPVNLMRPRADQREEADMFLEKMDKDLLKILNSTKNRLDTLEEVTTSLTCRRFYPLRNGKGFVNGIDCGAKWWSLVIAMFTIGLILPGFFYYFFTYVKPHR